MSLLFGQKNGVPAEDDYNPTMATAAFGERVGGRRYKMPLLPGETGPKSIKGADWVSGGVRSTTNLAGAISDTRALGDWERERTQIGLGLRVDLQERLAYLIQSARRRDVDWSNLGQHPDLRAELKLIHDEAKTAAGGNVRTQMGTNRHDSWEARGKTGALFGTSAIQREIEALEKLLHDNHLVRVPGLSERVIRNTQFQAAGRFDDVLMHTPTGKLLMADLKGLALDTPLATPSGWTTMGEVQVGDYVFDKDGDPVRVTEKSDVKRIGTYVVRFDDGSEIVCDTEHIWWTGLASGASRDQMAMQARAIQEVIDTQRSPSGQNWHYVPNAGVLDTDWCDLPIDPWTLGVWLGDGHHTQGTICKESDLYELAWMSGRRVGRMTSSKVSSTVIYFSFLGLRAQLREQGLLGNKHIPAQYLRARGDQRLQLLQGLMDTDGTWNKRRRTAVFNSTDRALAEQVVELVTTLGQRAHLAEYEARGFGKTVIAYAVEFTPIGIDPFTLPRKRDLAAASTKNTSKASRRLIVSIEPGPDVPTACIGVDSPSSTYLAGERMIPTHNTKQKPFWSLLEVRIQLAVYASAEWMLNFGTEYTPGPLHHVDQQWGVVLHAPSSGEAPKLLRINLELGRRDARRALDVIESRSQGKSKDAFGEAVWDDADPFS